MGRLGTKLARGAHGAAVAFALILLAGLSGSASAEHGPVGTTQLVSRPDGAAAPTPGAVHDSGLDSPDAVSANGRFLAFTSSSDGLSSEDDNRFSNIFVRDAQTGTVTLVSRATGASGAPAQEGSRQPAISADGRRVAFTTPARLDPADTNTRDDVYLRDLTTNTTTLVSRTNGSSGAVGNNNSSRPSLDGTGTHIAFASVATNFASGDTHGKSQIYIRDLTQQSTSLVSRDSGIMGAIGDGTSVDPSISDNGQTIVFTSEATNLGGGATSRPQVYRRELGGALYPTTLESKDSSSTAANRASNSPSISGDGKSIAFLSSATNLDPADTNDRADVFVRELTGSSTTLVSRQNGLAGAVEDKGAEGPPSLSTNGKTITFTTNATNLSSADANGLRDVYVRTLAGTTTLASRATGAAGAVGDNVSRVPALSGDGTKLYFASNASNLGSGTPDFRQVYLRDLGGQTTTFVSRPGTAPFVGDDNNAESQSGHAQVSADGRYVVFASQADRLSTQDDNRYWNIFMRDTLLDRTVLVSLAASGAAANASSRQPTISADGSTVAFTSDATNLVPGDTNGYRDVFVRKLATGQLTRVGSATGNTGLGGLSATGAALTFSGRGQYITGISSPEEQVYLRNVATGATILISRATGATGAMGDDDSRSPSLSGDGTKVAFVSAASNLATGVTTQQIYLRNVATNTTTLVSRPNGTASLPNDAAGEGVVNAAGTVVAFEGYATNLVPGDVNDEEDIFVRNLAANTTTLVSRADGPAGFQGNGGSYSPAVSADGSKIAFNSSATNIVPGDTNEEDEVFVRDPAVGTTTLVSTSAAGLPDGGYDPSVSGNGACVFYYSPGGVSTGGAYSDFERGFMRTLSGECPIDLPETTILKGPKGRTTKRHAVFRFGSTEPGVTFRCKLDRRGFKKCGSTYRTPKLKLGKHRLVVRAIDAAGNPDPTPAVRIWRVRRAR